MLLETLGPVLLFLPFNVCLQRMIAVGSFILFHLGLALTMELGHFPWVCMVAWLPLLPGSLWDRLAAALRPAGEGVSIVHDPERSWARNGTFALRMWLFLWEAKHEPAGEGLASRLRDQGGWGVVGGEEVLTGTPALARLLAASPVYFPLAGLASSFPGRIVSALVGGRAGWKAREPARPGWTPPGGLVVRAVVLFLLAYLVLLNTRSFGYTRDQAFPDPNRPPERWRDVLPNLNYNFGAALGIDQGWGLFAPRPGVYAGWFQAVGVRKDGARVDLLAGRVFEDEEEESRKPALPSAVFYNNRWRKLMQNTAGFDMSAIPNEPTPLGESWRAPGDPPGYPRWMRFPNDPRDPRWGYSYLLPGLARYLHREWDAGHEGREQLEAVELVWWQEQTRPPGEPVPSPRRIVLMRYEPDAGPLALHQYQYYNPLFSRKVDDPGP
jgi:hypothetical protein